MRYHKNIRLETQTYKNHYLPCSITICTKNRGEIFSDKSLARDFLNLLQSYSKQNDIPVYAYCIMPDHVHLLMNASNKKDIVGFIREIKSLSTRIAWKHHHKGGIWQISFYDHFLRKDEDLRQVANYIVENPVRKGLVDNWRDYELCGSLVWDL